MYLARRWRQLCKTSFASFTPLTIRWGEKMNNIFICVVSLLLTAIAVSQKYRIQSLDVGNLVVDLEDEDTCPNVAVILCPVANKNSQQWEFYNDHYLRNVHSGMYLDIRRPVKNGQHVTVWPPHGKNTQKWVSLSDGGLMNWRRFFLNVDSTGVGSNVTVQRAFNTTLGGCDRFYIRHKATQLYLDIEDNVKCSDASVVINKYNRTGWNQVWETYNSTMLRNAGTGKFLDIFDPIKDGQYVTVRSPFGEKRQKWFPRVDGGILNWAKYYLTTESNNEGAKAIVKQNYNESNSQQQWEIVPL